MKKFFDQFRVTKTKSVIWEKCHENAIIPHRAEHGSAGFDLYSVEKVVIKPSERKLIRTGLKWQPNSNKLEMQIRPRSGMALKYGITVLNSPGTVDSSYRDEIKVLLINHGEQDYTIEIGDRIAQSIFSEIKDIEFIEGDVQCNTERNGGFESTGK